MTESIGNDNRANKHRVYYSGCSVSHWKDGIACGHKEDWTERVIHSIPFATDVSEPFGNSKAQRRQFDMVMRIIECAFVAGIREQQQRVKEVLGIKDPRR